MENRCTQAAYAPSRRQVLRFLLASGPGLALAADAGGGPAADDLRNPLLWAVAWKRNAAEFGALCHQAYNLARLLLDQALEQAAPDGRPLAVITDVDDTILHAGDYWATLIARGGEFFDDALWDQWIPQNRMTVVPGALEFCRYCAERDVAVFYVTSRDQGERTREFALGHLSQLGFPLADPDHLVVFRDTSDKSPAREAISRQYRVPFLMGDNLNDFRRDYYVADVEERMSLMDRDRQDWGRKFILLPNPTDGHWVRAIFGESEPHPTPGNRRRLFAAATGRPPPGE